METKNILVFFAICAFAVFSAVQVSAFGTINSVTVNGIENFGAQAGVFAGETIPVRVIFTANASAEDVRITARILGESGLSQTTERFDVIAGSQYSRLLNIKLPFDIDPNESYTLVVSVESNSQLADEQSIDLEVQRVNYLTEVLSVEAPSKVQAGKALPLDVVLKNRGRHFAEDNYVTARIPSLGISRTVYFGDLSDEDQSDPDKEDANERRIVLDIPSDALEGVYTIEVEAFNGDSTTLSTKRVFISGSDADSGVYSSSRSKTFAVGEQATYTVTLVNAGDKIQVYELVPGTNSDLSIDFDNSVVAVPAGSSKTVSMLVSADKAGKYDFSVDVMSNGKTVKTESFSANVQGTKIAGGSMTVLLTVVLAIVFIVLLVVLIVLLTRKPEKVENFGESYY